MEKTEQIKIGNIAFLKESLTDKTLDQAQKENSHIDKRIVESAFNIANPNWKKAIKKTVAETETKKKDNVKKDNSPEE